ncbi:MAG: putative selenate ABC transporter substrate-binding protein [Deltaproteobacteria bacterium]|nr:putative selenate ABC transporter substrate-binding protein [Deltaproteobacteria bacterium]
MKKFLFIVTILVLFSSLSVAQTLRFTAIPDEDTSRLQVRFSKVAEYLSKQLAVPVKYLPVKSYNASVAAFKYNQVQLAWFGGLSGVQARMAVRGSKAIAQGEEDQQFVTYFIANTSLGLNETKEFPSEIKGKTFTFGSKGSTSGRLMPEFYIRQQTKKTPQEFFRRVGFSGDHSKTIALVQSGSYQVGAVNYKVWEKQLSQGIIDLTQVRVIWKTPAYVDYNWTIRGDVESVFGKGFIQKVQNALLEMKDKKLLESFPRTRFIKASNELYTPILKTGQSIGILNK